MLYDNYKRNYKLPIQNRVDYDKAKQNIYDTYSKLTLKKYSFYEIKDIYCKNNCLLVNSVDKPLYFDSHHLNLTGAILMEPLFDTILTNVYQ